MSPCKGESLEDCFVVLLDRVSKWNCQLELLIYAEL